MFGDMGLAMQRSIHIWPRLACIYDMYIYEHICIYARGLYLCVHTGHLCIQAARSAAEQPPRWVPFDEAPPSCACCGAHFSWESTFQSNAQQVNARHHCRRCGMVVCDGCSRQRVVLPQYGIINAVRVCDGCYYRA